MIGIRDLMFMAMGSAVTTIASMLTKYIFGGDLLANRKSKLLKDIEGEIINELNSSAENCDTNYLYNKYKNDFRDIYEINNFLNTLEFEGKIRKLISDGTDINNQLWLPC